VVILPGRLASNLQVLKPLQPVYEARGLVDKNTQTSPLLTIFVFYNRKNSSVYKKTRGSSKQTKQTLFIIMLWYIPICKKALQITINSHFKHNETTTPCIINHLIAYTIKHFHAFSTIFFSETCKGHWTMEGLQLTEKSKSNAIA
jgi:hypothetical protein